MGVGVTRVAYVIRPGGDIVITFKADFAAAPATDGLYHHVDIHFISKHHIQRWIQRSRELPNMNRRGILHSCNDSLEQPVRVIGYESKSKLCPQLLPCHSLSQTRWYWKSLGYELHLLAHRMADRTRFTKQEMVNNI